MDLLLAHLQASKGYEFFLAFRPPNQELRILHTPFVSTNQRLQIEDILENRPPDQATVASRTILKILPALIKTKDLVLCTKNDVGTLKSTHRVVEHYKNLTHAMSQLVCKTIAKEWIRVLEPRKQSTFPYKNFNESKPHWWPADVDHIEPDHLEKKGRVRLLVSILRNPHVDLLSLKRRTDSALAAKPLTLRILDELYYVAIYDRVMLCGSTAQQKKLACLLSPHDQQIIHTKAVILRISDILVRSNPLMVSKMTPQLFSSATFDLRPAGEQAAKEASHFDPVAGDEQNLRRNKRRRIEEEFSVQPPPSRGTDTATLTSHAPSYVLAYQLQQFSQQGQPNTSETSMDSPLADLKLDSTNPHPIQEDEPTQTFAAQAFGIQPYLALERREALHRRHSSPLLMGSAPFNEVPQHLYDENVRSDPESPNSGFFETSGG